ncbi:Acyltransferase [Spraguea lophii 42_110]|uniref:Acyltransferase n=1 Tax=Spraguea lophii (strain 42_110) TaxID=1358809 RepID=S7W935_SPRLO|nr:Acyltransferase [Spraguea lophii 42_110]
MIIILLKKYLLFLLTFIIGSTSICLPVLCPIFKIFTQRGCITFVSIYSYIIWNLYSIIFNLTSHIEFEDIEELEKIEDYDNCILLSNHVAAIDFLVLHEIAKKKKMLKNLKYVLKTSLIFIPFIGTGIYFLKFCFISRSIKKDKEKLKNWCRFIQQNKIPTWLVVYPEGTRFTKEKQKASETFCREKNIEPFTNVLYPRIKGFEILQPNSKKYLTKIVDVTLQYFNTDETKEIPSLAKFYLQQPKGYFKAKIKVTNAEDIKNPGEFLKESFKMKGETIERWKREINHKEN